MNPGTRGLTRAALVLFALAGTCAAQDEPTDAEVAEAIAEWNAAAMRVARMQDLESSGLARAESRFGLELLRQLVASDPAANHLVSPLGAFTVLNLAAEGASESLRRQLDDVLHVQALDRPSLRRALGTLLQNLATREDSRIDVACSLWFDKALTPSPGFVAAARDGYAVTVSNLEFADPTSVKAINDWADASTHGTIPSVLDDLSPQSSMLALTVTSFTASWLHHFESEETQPRAFTDAAGASSEVPMMHVFQNFAYEHDTNLGAQIVRLPCLAYPADAEEDVTCSLYVILPDSGSSVTSVLERLVEQPLSWLFSYRHLARAQEMSGDVWLPRFRHSRELDLAAVLARMGLEDALVSGGFSGIAKGTGSSPFEMRESNTINVDENGVAATSADLVIPFSAAGESSSFSFLADHPFVYVLFDEPTGALLFAGVMNKPD